MLPRVRGCRGSSWGGAYLNLASIVHGGSLAAHRLPKILSLLEYRVCKVVLDLLHPQYFDLKRKDGNVDS